MRVLLASCLLGCSVGQDLFLGKQDNEVDADVIIIGAGWAGMSAAKELHKANVSFKVLEMGYRTGGRSVATKFGHESVGKVVLEMGSGWICGTGGGAATGVDDDRPTVNPNYKEAIEAGVSMGRIAGSTMNMSTYALFDADGKLADLDGSLRRRANEAYDCLNATALQTEDLDVRTALTQCGWVPQSELEWAIDWALTEDDPGYKASLQSLHKPDSTYQMWGPDDHVMLEQDPRGYAKVLDHMVKDTVPPGDSRVVFGAAVTKITYNSQGVTLQTRKGQTYKAKEVISTIPLGVMQRKHAELFDPPIPQKKAELLESGMVVMANLTKIALQFPTVWWDNSLPRWMSAVHGANTTEASGEFTEWENINHADALPNSQILVVFLGDPQSTKYEAMANAEVEAVAMRNLRMQHPGKSVPDPIAFFMSRWGRAPASYGAYSGFRPGFKDKMFKTLMAPLKADKQARVHFAGEAMCDDMSGFTHGARQSGLEVAAKYLHSVGKGPKPSRVDGLSLCWW